MSSIWDQTATGQSAAPIDVEEVRRALAVLADPAHGVELRGLPSGRSVTLPAGDTGGLCRAAESLADGKGVYFGLNPVAPRPGSGSGGTQTARDVLRRRWLLIDLDPRRPADTNATDAEKEGAKGLAGVVEGWLLLQGWPEPALVDSGNGWHLLYRIDLPNDEQGTALLGRFLRALARRFDSDAADVDTKVHNAARVSKLPGTWARKGPPSPERPHRLCRLIRAPDDPAVVPREMIERTLGALSPEAEPPPAPSTVVGAVFEAVATDGASALDRARAYARKEPPAVSGQRGHDRCWHVANVLVNGFALDPAQALQAIQDWNATCRPPWSEKELRHKIEDALEKNRAPRGYLLGGASGANGHAPAAPPPLPAVGPGDVATIADLRAAGALVRWVWPGWIPLGVLTAVAARGGTGKTRFCADLLRRVRHGLPWPDGRPMTVPREATAMWVVADNHHDEMVTLAESFGIEDAIFLNADKADPYGGVTLDAPEDYAALEARVKAVRPLLVIVDTVGNATDLNLSRQEEAKKFYAPLQIIARKYACAVLALTHLNAGGHFLGRRVLEKVRVAIRIENPEPDNEANTRRRLEVKKTNSKAPPPLGVTMGDRSNEYDDRPPEAVDPDAPQKRGPAPAKVQEAVEWLRQRLSRGAQKVGYTIESAQAEGISKGTLYRSKDILTVVQFESEGNKWWRLPQDDEDF